MRWLRLFGRGLEPLFAVPAALVSLAFSRVVRWLTGIARRRLDRRRFGSTPAWQVVDGDFLRGTGKLLYAMSHARWNTHALVAIGGPFEAQRRVEIATAAGAASAGSWTCVIHALPHNRAVASAGSLSDDAGAVWMTREVAPGRYRIGLRMYDWRERVELPEIRADGATVLPSTVIEASPDANAFYRDLIAARGLPHLALNFYVFYLLRYRRWVPERIVRNVFLPVPNPETRFYFGAVRTGEILRLRAEPDVLERFSVMVSIYCALCFPLEFFTLEEPERLLPPAGRRSIYVVRVHPRFSTRDTYAEGAVRVDTIVPTQPRP